MTFLEFCELVTAEPLSEYQKEVIVEFDRVFTEARKQGKAYWYIC